MPPLATSTAFPLLPSVLRQEPPRAARPRITGWLAAAVAFATGLSAPAPVAAQDLKKLPSLPALPNFFKRADNDLIETAHAPVGPGDMAVLPGGEYIVSCHQFFHPQHRVLKLERGGAWVPFPNLSMNTPGSGNPAALDSVLGLAADSRGIVWMLDNGRRSDVPPKLVAWDTRRDELHRVIAIGPHALASTSFLRNLVLDPSLPYLYISDPADGAQSAIVVVNIETGLSWRVLEGHHSVQRDPGVQLELEGRPIAVRRPDGEPAHPLTGVSPIAIDRRGEWLYYGPRNGASLFRIRADLLRRQDIIASVLESQVAGVSPKPICDSMVIDARGRIYFGDISRGAIDYVSPDEDYLNLRLLVQDPRIAWPGGLLFGPDGNLHFFSSQLHRTPVLNGGKDASAPPFSIFQAKPLPVGRFTFGN